MSLPIGVYTIPDWNHSCCCAVEVSPRGFCWSLQGSSVTPLVSPPPGSHPCGGFLTQSSGQFSSPSYPSNYPNNANCVWDIEVANNDRITIVFRDVQ